MALALEDFQAALTALQNRSQECQPQTGEDERPAALPPKFYMVFLVHIMWARLLW